jgi:hypothetical protein
VSHTHTGQHLQEEEKKNLFHPHFLLFFGHPIPDGLLFPKFFIERVENAVAFREGFTTAS